MHSEGFESVQTSRKSEEYPGRHTHKNHGYLKLPHQGFKMKKSWHKTSVPPRTIIIQQISSDVEYTDEEWLSLSGKKPLDEGAVLLWFSVSPFTRQGFNPPSPRTAEKAALSVFLPRDRAHLLSLRYCIPQHSHNAPGWSSQLEPTQLEAAGNWSCSETIRTEPTILSLLAPCSSSCWAMGTNPTVYHSMSLYIIVNAYIPI